MLFWRKVKYVAKYTFLCYFIGGAQIFPSAIFYAFPISELDYSPPHPLKRVPPPFRWGPFLGLICFPPIFFPI